MKQYGGRKYNPSDVPEYPAIPPGRQQFSRVGPYGVKKDHDYSRIQRSREEMWPRDRGGYPREVPNFQGRRPESFYPPGAAYNEPSISSYQIDPRKSPHYTRGGAGSGWRDWRGDMHDKERRRWEGMPPPPPNPANTMRRPFPDHPNTSDSYRPSRGYSHDGQLHPDNSNNNNNSSSNSTNSNNNNNNSTSNGDSSLPGPPGGPMVWPNTPPASMYKPFPPNIDIGGVNTMNTTHIPSPMPPYSASSSEKYSPYDQSEMMMKSSAQQPPPPSSVNYMNGKPPFYDGKIVSSSSALKDFAKIVHPSQLKRDTTVAGGEQLHSSAPMISTTPLLPPPPPPASPPSSPEEDLPSKEEIVTQMDHLDTEISQIEELIDEQRKLKIECQKPADRANLSEVDKLLFSNQEIAAMNVKQMRLFHAKEASAKVKPSFVYVCDNVAQHHYLRPRMMLFFKRTLLLKKQQEKALADQYHEKKESWLRGLRLKRQQLLQQQQNASLSSSSGEHHHTNDSSSSNNNSDASMDTTSSQSTSTSGTTSASSSSSLLTSRSPAGGGGNANSESGAFFPPSSPSTTTLPTSPLITSTPVNKNTTTTTTATNNSNSNNNGTPSSTNTSNLAKPATTNTSTLKDSVKPPNTILFRNTSFEIMPDPGRSSLTSSGSEYSQKFRNSFELISPLHDHDGKHPVVWEVDERFSSTPPSSTSSNSNSHHHHHHSSSNPLHSSSPAFSLTTSSSSPGTTFDDANRMETNTTTNTASGPVLPASFTAGGFHRSSSSPTGHRHPPSFLRHSTSDLFVSQHSTPPFSSSSSLRHSAENVIQAAAATQDIDHSTSLDETTAFINQHEHDHHSESDDMEDPSNLLLLSCSGESNQQLTSIEPEVAAAMIMNEIEEDAMDEEEDEEDNDADLQIVADDFDSDVG